jgi:hypothetical protein
MPRVAIPVVRPTGQLGTPVSLFSLAAALVRRKKRAGAADCLTDSRVGSRWVRVGSNEEGAQRGGLLSDRVSQFVGERVTTSPI